MGYTHQIIRKTGAIQQTRESWGDTMNIDHGSYEVWSRLTVVYGPFGGTWGGLTKVLTTIRGLAESSPAALWNFLF